MRSYLSAAPRGTAKQLATDAQVSPGTITDIAKDRFFPSRDVWNRIFVATAGQVTPTDHLPAARDGANNGR